MYIVYEVSGKNTLFFFILIMSKFPLSIMCKLFSVILLFVAQLKIQRDINVISIKLAEFKNFKNNRIQLNFLDISMNIMCFQQQQKCIFLFVRYKNHSVLYCVCVGHFHLKWEGIFFILCESDGNETIENETWEK